MFGSLGFPEIAFILVLALLVFGPRKLPEIGRTLGRGLGEFRRATNDLRRSIETEIAAEETPARPAPAPVTPVPTAVAAEPAPGPAPAADVSDGDPQTADPAVAEGGDAEEAESADDDGRTEA